MFVAEVVESKTCYKSGQSDDEGNPLPLGSIQIRIGSHQSNAGQVRNVYARPLHFSARRLPLIGEQVFVISGPVNDWTTSGLKQTGFLYFQPLNSTDDPVLHAFPKLWKRDKPGSGGQAGQRKADREEPGYSFPKSPKLIDSIQPFEGDDIYEGRFGQSIRFGSSVVGDLSIYEKKPSWKGTSNGDPLMILRLKKPTGGTAGGQSSSGIYNAHPKYGIEDIGTDEASIYLTSTQMLTKFKAGFTKNMDVKTSANWGSGSQIVISADRVILNALANKAFVIGKDAVVITGKQVLFQSENYKVDLDDLMDFLKKWLGEDVKLAQGQSQYSTASGPTAVATSMAQYLQLKTADFQKFKMP